MENKHIARRSKTECHTTQSDRWHVRHKTTTATNNNNNDNDNIKHDLAIGAGGAGPRGGGRIPWVPATGVDWLERFRGSPEEIGAQLLHATATRLKDVGAPRLGSDGFLRACLLSMAAACSRQSARVERLAVQWESVRRAAFSACANG